MKKIKHSIRFLLAAVLLCAVFIQFLLHRFLPGVQGNALSDSSPVTYPESAIEVVSGSNGRYIKWVDFKITSEALSKAYALDVESYDKEIHLNWIELLAYAGARCGGSFDKSSLTLLDKLAKELSEKETTLEELTQDMEYYEYYLEAYEAVLGGMVGEYEIEQDDGAGGKIRKKVYGLKAFSPIAKGFEYSDYDDFGSSRSYGYRRPHLGHDMMGQIGTPIRIKC